MKKIDTIIWYCLLLTYTISSILFCVLLFNNGFSDIEIFLLIFMIFGFVILLYVFLTRGDRINSNLLSYEKKDDSLIIKYNNYMIEVIKNYKVKAFDVPKYDINNNKINFILRGALRNYLEKQYDFLSLPENVIPVEICDLKKYFKELKLCDEKNKISIINKRHFKLLYIVIFILFLINIKYIVEAIISHSISPFLFIFIGVLIILFVINYVIDDNEKKEEVNGEVYSCKVHIFDKSSKIYDEGDYYYIRVCDNNNHVLMKWFQVDKNFYENGKSGTLYYIIAGTNYDVEFEKGED